MVTGPPRAGVTAMAAALRQRMPAFRFVEAGDITATTPLAAVVFVVSAVAPIVESDCAVLDSVVDADVVIAVVSKIDDHRDWRRVLSVDRELLGSHVAWVGAAAAPRLGEPDVDELCSLLHAELRDPATRARSAVRRRESRLGELHDEREELLRRRRLAASDRARALRGDVQQARLVLTQTARRRGAALRADLISQAATVARREVPRFATGVRQRCDEVLAEVDADIDAHLPVHIAAHAGQVVIPPPIDVADPPLRSRRLENRLITVLGAGFGVGVALVVTRFVAGLAPGLAAAGLAAGIGVGAATAVWVIRARALLHVRAVLQAWAADAAVAVRVAAEEKVALAVLDAEAALASESVAMASHEDAEFRREITSIDAEIRKLTRIQKDPSLLPIGRPTGDTHLNRSCE